MRRLLALLFLVVAAVGARATVAMAEPSGSTAIYSYDAIAQSTPTHRAAGPTRSLSARPADTTASGHEQTVSSPIAVVVAAEGDASFGTESGQAVFWSGLGRGGASRAAEFAAKSGGTTLEQTAGAAALPAYDSANAASVAAWREASAAFARGASGDVRVLLGNSGAESVWNTVEFPALQANPAVTSITAIDPATGESSFLWGR